MRPVAQSAPERSFMRLNKLLSPGKIGTLELKNRFVVPPMGTNFATYGGEVTDDMIAYYRRRAKGGFGLIIIEVTAIDRKGKAIVNEVGLWDDSQIPGFKKLMDAIHEEGGKVVVQLHHAGRQSVPPYIFNEMPEAPSKVACPMLNFIPEAMTNERVWEVIDEFGDAAVRAKKAGADGVEVHGAHGYLVAQFMSPHANKRTDEFGGDFFGRMKFPQEVFKNIRSKVGDDYPLLFRFGHDEKVNGGRTLEESVMVGGGMTGVETADFLAEHNKAVTIVEMRPDIALDEATAPRFFLIPRLKEHGVDWIVNATVRKILPDGVVYEQNGTEYTLGGYDTIVLALGVRPNNPLEEAARALGKEVYVIGDASQPAPANKATEAALDAVLKLG